MLKKVFNKPVLILLFMLSTGVVMWVYSNYPRWVIVKGESSAFRSLIDILLVQSEFQKRALFNNNNNKIGEFADFESLLEADIVIRDLSWDL
ncbi:hypothetical protein [Candidatus Uabimicrobium sp. HlEnr_7]|uniref:hypothetical protein n=1 Tax=Candidatus Uabimicrobium helgolandensis TaxID=3095367 RepID=UPI003556C8BE